MPAASHTPAVALVVDASSDADRPLLRDLGKHADNQGWAMTWIVSDVDQFALLPDDLAATSSIGVPLPAGNVADLDAVVERLRSAGANVDAIQSARPIASTLAARLAAYGIRGVVSRAPSASASELRPIGSGVWQAGVDVQFPAARRFASLLRKSPRQRLSAHRSGLLVAGLNLQLACRSARLQRELTGLLEWLGEAPTDRFALQSIGDAIAARDARAVARPQRSILRAA